MLGELPLYDIIWDVCPDAMHIVKNLFDRCLIPLLSGKRAPTGQNLKNPKIGSSGYAERHARYQAEILRLRVAQNAAAEVTFSSRSQGEVDRRVRTLSDAVEAWIPRSLVNISYIIF